MDRTAVLALREEDYWLGSFYEVGMEFAPGSLDLSQRRHLLQVVWRDPEVTGAVPNWRDLGQPWSTLEDAVVSPGAHYYGCLRLGQRLLGCGTFFTEDDNGVWFALYLPLGMLERAYPIDYGSPITREGNPWTSEVDAILASIAMRVYRAIPFELGILGQEASALVSSREVTPEQLVNTSDLLVPDALFERLQVPPHGLRAPEGVWWTGGREGLR